MYYMPHCKFCLKNEFQIVGVQKYFDFECLKNWAVYICIYMYIQVCTCIITCQNFANWGGECFLPRPGYSRYIRYILTEIYRQTSIFGYNNHDIISIVCMYGI